MSNSESDAFNEKDIDDAIEREKQAELEMQRRIEQFRNWEGTGIGNAEQQLENEPQDLKEMRENFNAKSEELRTIRAEAEELLNSKLKEHSEYKSGGEEDLLGVLEKATREYGADKQLQMLSPEVKARLDQLGTEANRLESELDALKKSINKRWKEFHHLK